MNKNYDLLVSIFAFFSIAVVFVSDSVYGQETNNRFEDQINRYEKMSQENPPSKNCTIFIGGSNFTYWKDSLEKAFQKYNAVNRGFGGARTRDIISALDRLVLPFYPARVVIFIGTNDIASGVSPETAFDNFRIILAKIWENNPTCEIFFVSPTHAPSREKFWEKGDVFDGYIKKMATQLDGFYHIDITTPMNDNQGQVMKEFYVDDMLHLSEKGRALWVRLISNAIDKSLNEQHHKNPEELKQQCLKAGIVFP